jgi:hypothetical protein
MRYKSPIEGGYYQFVTDNPGRVPNWGSKWNRSVEIESHHEKYPNFTWIEWPNAEQKFANLFDKNRAQKRVGGQTRI